MFMSSNLSHIKIFSQTTNSFLAFTNWDYQTFDIWYWHLSNLEWQNIVQLAKIAEKIDLFQPSLSNLYFSCDFSILEVETHINATFLGQKRLDFVNNNCKKRCLPASNGIQYIVSFLENDTKNSEVCFFKEKSTAIQAFQSYLA